MKKILRFFKDSYSELRRVVWPSKSEVLTSTRVVLISVSFFAILLGLLDLLFLTGIDFLF